MANPIEGRARQLTNLGIKAARIAASAGLFATTLGFPAQPVQAHGEAPISPACGELETTKPVIIGNNIDSTRFQVKVLPACQAGLLGIEAQIDELNILHNGENSKNEQGFITVNLQNVGNNTFQTGEITYDPTYHYNGDYQNNPGLHSALVIRTASLTFKYQAGSKIFPVDKRLLILDKDASLSQVRDLDATAQSTPFVLNIVGDESVVSRIITSSGAIADQESLEKMTNKIYELTPGIDEYDRIYFYTNKKTILTNPTDSANKNGAVAITTKHDFSGTGIEKNSSVEVSQMFGSKGRLKQVIPTTSTDYRALLHENNHETAGKMSKDGAKLSDGSHYLKNVSAASPLGGIKVKKEANGTLVSDGVSRDYMSPLDLYTHGWISAEELKQQQPEIYIFQDTNQRFDRRGTVLTGPVAVITPQKLVETYGVRTPGPEAAQRSFKDLFVVVSPKKLTPAEMTAFDLLVKGYEPYYNKGTLGHSDVKFITPEKQQTSVPAPGLEILNPAKGATLSSLDASFGVTVPVETTCLHYQVIPFNNDGPARDMLNCDPEDLKDGRVDISMPSPVFGTGPYEMLPGMTYERRARTTTKSNPDIQNPTDWTPWKVDKFRTPPPLTDINPGTQTGISIQSLNPSLTWSYSNPSIFYSEVQVSGNTRFDTNPQTADSFVWWNLVHGGVTTPPNSWATPPLTPNTTYYWRVRPRVQGDGQEVPFGPTWSFTTAPNASIQEGN